MTGRCDLAAVVHPERLLRVGDVELCVQEVGDPADPLVLLLSGRGASMDWWDLELCRRLADAGRRVVRYDHRDTGRSTTWPPGEPGYDAGAVDRDAAGLVEALGAPAHLVGISMGGAIAQWLALHRPALVAGLTLVATSPIGGVDATLPGPTPELSALFTDPPPDPDWSDRAAYVEWGLSGERGFAGAAPLDEERARRILGEVFDRSTDVAAAGNHGLAPPKAGEAGEDGVDGGDGGTDDVRRIATPTLVVHGEHDPLFPLPHGEALAAAVPGARLLVLPVGHQVPPAPTWDVFVPAVLEVTGG